MRPPIQRQKQALDAATSSTQARSGPSGSSGKDRLRASLAGQSLSEQSAAVAPDAFSIQGRGKLSPGGDVQAAAARGQSGSSTTLPHLDVIQTSFGRHDVSSVDAYVGGAAAEATASMGAEAYATGNATVFGGGPDLHTAAHEAAHVVQQRGGVQLSGGVGQVGDRYEQHADQVADAVVQGRSAEGLLDPFAGAGAGSAVQAVVQRKETDQENVLRTVKAYTGEGEAAYKAAFDRYASAPSDQGGVVDHAGVVRLLTDAGVVIKKLGIPVPMGPVANAVIDHFDTSGDRSIGWDEFLVGLG